MYEVGATLGAMGEIEPLRPQTGWRTIYPPDAAARTCLLPAFVSCLLGIGLDAMANALAQAYPNAPHWLWLAMFWLGVLMFSALPAWFFFWLTQRLNIRWRLFAASLAVLIIVGVLFAILSMSGAQPIPAPPKPFKTGPIYADCNMMVARLQVPPTGVYYVLFIDSYMRGPPLAAVGNRVTLTQMTGSPGYANVPTGNPMFYRCTIANYDARTPLFNILYPMRLIQIDAIRRSDGGFQNGNTLSDQIIWLQI